MTAPVQHRVVVDTNLIVGAGSNWVVRNLPTPNLAQRLLETIALAHIGLYSGKIIGEYAEKLLDYKHPKDRVQEYIGLILGTFEQVHITTAKTPHPPTDPDDEIFLLCAIDGNAAYLVSDDKHLLNVATHYHPPSILSATDAAPIFGL